MTTPQARQRKLLNWAARHDVVTQSEWARVAGVSLPTSRKDFAAMSEHFDPFTLGTKTMGWMLRGAA